MSNLRAQLLDAGIELVADHGLEGLVPCEVDRRAGVPDGTTQECFPTRQALVEGVADRCIEREMQMVAGDRPEVEASPDGVADALGRFVLRALDDDRSVTLSRYVLQAEAARTPALRAFYAVGADNVDTWALDLVRRAGSRHPERDFGLLANYVTGLVFHELALPTPDLDPVARVRDVIGALQWSAP